MQYLPIEDYRFGNFRWITAENRKHLEEAQKKWPNVTTQFEKEKTKLFHFHQEFIDPHSLKHIYSPHVIKAWHNAENHKLEDGNLRLGDHIYILIIRPVMYEHHGIFIGSMKVIHF